MSKTYQLVALMVLSLLIALDAIAADKVRIKKCQDARGEWHYGDDADEACAKSKITVIDNRGQKIKEIAAPPTEAEFATREASRAAAEAERKAKEEQAKRDQLLLATYGHEDDITVARDRKLAMVDAQIKSIETSMTSLRKTLTRMQAHAAQEKKQGAKGAEQAQKDIEKTEAQIKDQEASLVVRHKEQEAIKEHYAKELQRYRVVKAQAVRTAPSKK